jgi:hypothetical protein
MFAEFLRERVGKVSPEKRITELITQLARKRDIVKKERGLPDFIDGVYAEAEKYAKKALKSLRAAEAGKAKALYYAANVYHDRAERDVKETREIGEKLVELLAKAPS